MSCQAVLSAMRQIGSGVTSRAVPAGLARAHLHPFRAAGSQGGRHLARQQHGTARSEAASPVHANLREPQDECIIEDDIGFIGAGQMGEAMMRGFLSAGLTHRDKLHASVRSETRAAALSSLGVSRVYRDAVKEGGAEALAARARVIVLGVKPQAMPGVLAALAPHVGAEHLVVSIAAGVTLDGLQAALGPEVRLARVMPNTPVLVGQGACAYAMGESATPADAETVHALLSGVGLALPVPESAMDAVTGVSGSGPAYAYMMIEAMADGGVAAGLPRAAALALAAKTLAGAAAMVLGEEREGGLDLTHPGVLKDRVGSPAGTTMAAIAELENAGLRGAVIRAVRAAAARSAELGKA